MKVKKIFLWTLLMLCFSLCAHAQDRDIEYILNRCWDSTNESLKATVSGNISGDTITADVLEVRERYYNDAFVTFTDADTTPDVSAGNKFLTANTGATSITNFDLGHETQEIVIHFGDANTTLVNGATLNLQGAVNFTGATGNSITLIKRGTVWYEDGRAGAGGVESDTLATVTSRGATTSTTCTFSRVTMDALTADTAYMSERTAPGTPLSGAGVLYVKSTDSLLYYKSDAGNEYSLTLSAGDISTDSITSDTAYLIAVAAKPATPENDRIVFFVSADNNVYSMDKNGYVDNKTKKEFDFTIIDPEVINSKVGIFHVDNDKYPAGIRLENVQITLPAVPTAGYELKFQEFSSANPPAFVSDIEKVSADNTESYKEVKTTSIDDRDISSDNYIWLDILSTDVAWVKGKCIFIAR